MLQNFRAYDQIETVIFKRQAGNIGCCKAPDTPPVFAQSVMQFEPLGGLGQIVILEVGSDSDNLGQTVSRAGVAAGSASDVKDLKSRFDFQPVKITNKP